MRHPAEIRQGYDKWCLQVGQEAGLQELNQRPWKSGTTLLKNLPVDSTGSEASFPLQEPLAFQKATCPPGYDLGQLGEFGTGWCLHPPKTSGSPGFNINTIQKNPYGMDFRVNPGGVRRRTAHCDPNPDSILL